MCLFVCVCVHAFVGACWRGGLDACTFKLSLSPHVFFGVLTRVCVHICSAVYRADQIVQGPIEEVQHRDNCLSSPDLKAAGQRQCRK